MSARCLRTYDHRLVQLVQRTGDIELATRRGVPRSTARGWMRQDRSGVVTDPLLEEAPAALHARIVRLERRVRRLGAMLRVLLALLRGLRPDLSRLRVPDGSDKRRLLRAIESTETGSIPSISPAWIWWNRAGLRSSDMAYYSPRMAD